MSLAPRAADDLGRREHVTGGLDRGDDHDDDHRDDRGGAEGGPAEVERRRHAEPVGRTHRTEIDVLEQRGDRSSDDQPGQHGDRGEEPAGKRRCMTTMISRVPAAYARSLSATSLFIASVVATDDVVGRDRQ